MLLQSFKDRLFKRGDKESPRGQMEVFIKEMVKKYRGIGKLRNHVAAETEKKKSALLDIENKLKRCKHKTSFGRSTSADSCKMCEKNLESIRQVEVEIIKFNHLQGLLRCYETISFIELEDIVDFRSEVFHSGNE